MYLLNRKLDKKRANNKIINPYIKYSFISYELLIKFSK